MDSKYEIIEHLDNLPYTCYLWEGTEQPLNWHNEIEIIMILEGSLSIEIRGTNYVLSKDDIVLINSHHIHRLSADNKSLNVKSASLEHSYDKPTALIFQFDPNYYQAYYQNFTDIIFHCNTVSIHRSPESHETLRKYLVKLMWLSLNKNKTYQLTGLKTSLEMVEFLIENFKKTLTSQSGSQDQIQQRLIRIIDHINKNFDKKITLADLAQKEFISLHYLSKFFKTHVGVGFNKYINQFRINKSLNDLMHSNKTILEIALDHGFSNSKSYTKLFKELYDNSPSEFRKGALPHNNSKDQSPLNNSETSQNVLMEYVNKYKRENADDGFIQVSPIKVDCNTITKEQFDFERILYFDFVYDGLNSNWQHNLEKIQSEINFDYIRFNGIFNKGMFFYSKKELSYNWFNIDNLLDFFLGINLKPFIELTYSEKDYSLKNWHILLEKFLAHCIKKYGQKEVDSWKFELASEDKSYEKAIKLYTSTLNRLSKNFGNLNFGILFAPAENFEEREYLRNFRDKNLSFMSVEMAEEFYFKKQELCKQLFHNISERMGLKTYFINAAEENNLNDTCYEAGAQIYNKLTNFRKIDTQVSFIDDLRNMNIFHGGLGLLTYNGLKKPVYNAFQLLSKLQGKILSSGPSHMITEDNNKIHILLYNYDKESSQLYMDQKKILSNQSYLAFKNNFANNSKSLINVSLKMESGKYRIRTKTLSEDSGCIYTQWVTMGSPTNLNKEDMKFLKARENIDIKISVTDVKDYLVIEEVVRHNEVKLVEVERV